MSAKQLEEFIGVIETAERLSHKESSMDSKRRSTSSLWSYPTDIFTPRVNQKDPGSSRSPSLSPMRMPRPLDKLSPPHGINKRPQVPKLWDAKHSSECLGSSWGSAASSTFAKNDDGSTTGINKSQHTPETGKSTNSNHIDSQPSTVRHIATKDSSRKNITSSERRSNRENGTNDSRIPRPSLTKQDTINTQHRKELMNMQKHSAFARIEARDISPAAPPSTPGSETKKSRRPMTARSTAKSSLPTPTTPQKTPNFSNSKEVDDSENKATNSRVDTQENGNSRTRKKQSLTDESIVEENEQKTSLNSSRRSSMLTSRSPSKEKKSPNSVRKSSTEGNELTDTSSPGSSASALARKSRLRRSPTMKSNKDAALTPSKGILSSRTDESISPPRSMPPRPLPRFNVKQAAFNDDDIIESEDDDNLHTVKVLSSNSNISKSKESSQQDRTTLSGIDPKRLERHMKNRPKSAPLKKQSNKENARPKYPQESDSSIDLRSYSKSLKLLGLNIPSNRREATKLENIDVEVRTSSPTMRTRLIKRTKSISDLRDKVAPPEDDASIPESIKHRIPKEEYQNIKNNLSQAVFEEWYFKKLEDDLKKKQTAQAKEEAKLYAEEMEKLEKKENSAIEYEKWLQTKKEQIKKAKRRKLRRDASKEKDSEEKQERIRRAELEWKEKKMQERRIAQKQLQKKAKKEMEEEKKKMEKRMDAAKTYQSWQASIDERKKAKREEERQQKLEAKQKQEENEMEKRENAEAAFKAWKEHKNNIEKERRARKKQDGNEIEDKKADKDLDAKLEAASKAYEEWLSFVEQREEDERLAEEDRLTRSMWRPPWYPPGTADV